MIRSVHLMSRRQQRVHPSSTGSGGIIRIQFDDTLIKKVPLNTLLADWQVEPPPPSSKAVGDAWVRQARSAVLALPSVIISGEPNYLLNSGHPDFKKIIIGESERFAFDLRLLARYPRPPRQNRGPHQSKPPR